MKVSEFQAAFAKVAQLVGDVEVKLTHATDEVESELKGFAVLIGTAEGVDKSAVMLVHGDPTPVTGAEATQG